MKTSWFISSLTFFCLAGSINAFSRTSQNYDTIFVDGDILVPIGQTLTINPMNGGTDLIFTGPFSIAVYGRLLLLGNVNDSIRLYPSDPDSGWHGIRFFNNSGNGQDSSVLQYCHFIKGRKLVRDEGMGGAVYAEESSRLKIRHCSFDSNTAIRGGAVGLMNSHPKLSDLFFRANHASYGGGLYVEQKAIPPTENGLLHSNDIQYLGAFRLPDVGTLSNWNYSGSASAFYPDGDPNGSQDGYPGSLFAVGHDWYFDIGEISIPVPVISPTKNPEDLNTATMLQPFQDVTNGFFDTIAYEIIRMGLEYLPAQGAQNTGKMYMCVGQHYQFSVDYSHIWFNPDLSNPETAGPWYFGNIPNYRTNDYMFSIPSDFANAHLNGKRLISGRYRDGGWSGKGPNMYAFSPWSEGNPPAPLAHLQNITHLLGYSDTDSLNGYKNADEWNGGAWMVHDSLSAVGIIGTKALGNCWYGFAEGTLWPNDSNYIPPWPYDQRGWWADGFDARILFYNPSDLAAVAAGTLQPGQLQPYDSLSFENRLYAPMHDLGRHQLGSCSYDRENGLIYVFERRADGDKCLVHVFKINPVSKKSPVTSTNPVMERMEFLNNSAVHSGGGISLNGASPAMNNFLIAGNTADFGAGISLEGVSVQPQLTNFTITDNEAASGGGAVYCDSASPWIVNSMLWANSAGISGNQIWLNNESSDPVVQYSDVEGGAPMFGGNGSGSHYNPASYQNNIDIDPGFVDNMGNYRLQDISPCVNAGNPVDTSGQFPVFDLDRNPRVFAGIVDMGCYELQQYGAFLTLGNYTVPPGQNPCLAATQTVTIAGNDKTFVVLNGGSVTIEAGESIDLKEGTTVNPGGYGLFRMEAGGNFCGFQQTMQGTHPGNVQLHESDSKRELVENKESFLKIYPNPNTGIFYLEFPEREQNENISVQIGDIRGRMVHQSTVAGMRRFAVDLSENRPGIYFIRVFMRDRMEVGKIIIQ